MIACGQGCVELSARAIGAAVETFSEDAPIAPSHHRPGGFTNPWPDSNPRGPLRLFAWYLGKRLRGRMPMDAPSFPTVEPQIRERVGDGDVAITWVGHSTLLVQMGGVNVLTDPMWSDRASPVQFAGPRRLVAPAVSLDALPAIDVVVLSHNHYDHMDRATIRELARIAPGARWVVPLGLADPLVKWGVRKTIELDWWQSVEVTTPGGALRVTATPAQHFSARGVHDRMKTLWCGFALATRTRRIYFAGDTAHHPEFARIGAALGPFDVVLMPVGAYEPRWFMRFVHVNPEDAVSACREIASATPRSSSMHVVPIHWGTFRLTVEPADEPPVRFEQAWREAGLDVGRVWRLRHGETRTLSATA